MERKRLGAGVRQPGFVEVCEREHPIKVVTALALFFYNNKYGSQIVTTVVDSIMNNFSAGPSQHQ